VYADVMVSLNARPAARLIDPEVDLAQVDDGLAVATWILPAPTAPPPLMSRLRLTASRMADDRPATASAP